MAAVDATEVVRDAVRRHEAARLYLSMHEQHVVSQAALAALFDRAGIDGAGTIALTRDDEGRYGLEKQDGYPPLDGVVWYGRRAWLVPVEDDEEGGEPCDALGHDTETTHMDADGHTTWRCRRCGAEGWDDEEGDRSGSA